MMKEELAQVRMLAREEISFAATDNADMKDVVMDAVATEVRKAMSEVRKVVAVLEGKVEALKAEARSVKADKKPAERVSKPTK